jgi:hypothetical protein
MSSRRGCGDEEKLAQMALMDSLSSSGRSSRAYDNVNPEKDNATRNQVRGKNHTHLLKFEICPLISDPLVSDV